ncbi:MAG: ATP-binding protein [Bacteroidales bacterium]|nr:ATP-binding protein [Bacteroidales bacterium]
MILLSELELAFNMQQSLFMSIDTGIERYLDPHPGLTAHVDIITGIRRCGKSTCLRQIAKAIDGDVSFFSFEDSRIFGFNAEDFPKLLQVMGGNKKAYFFDEIQDIPGWEIFVRNLHDMGRKVYLTGSNASLLSRELGTRLTGRHINFELYPFSFSEFLKFFSLLPSVDSFKEFLVKGGFPEYLKFGEYTILQQLFKDIIYRDISVRYGVRNVKSLVDIALYLVSNTGKEYTLNRLKNNFNLGSVNTAGEYVGWYEDSYLIFTVPQFSWSAKSMSVNPKKVYTIDTGFAMANSLSFSNDTGRLLENAVFIELMRRKFRINYFKQTRECDFIAFGSRQVEGAYQVCMDLNLDNKNREIEGLIEALDFFELKSGTILTFDQEDKFVISGKEILVIPAWKWMLPNEFNL